MKFAYLLLMISMLMHTVVVSAQWNVFFFNENNRYSIPVSVIDSLKPTSSQFFDIFLKERTIKVPTDSVLFDTYASDTIVVDFQDDNISVYNPRPDFFDINVEQANVLIISNARKPFVCRATGHSNDGRLVIDADTTMTLILDNIELTSRHTNAVYLKKKKNVTIELAEGSTNILEDANEYNLTDSTDTSNGCLYARGSMTFKGSGVLSVRGNCRHGISSGKNIFLEDGHIIINDVIKDGIHCDKFTMKNGKVDLNLNTNSSKGIKTKEKLTVEGGIIEGIATGDLVIEEGETSYCTLLKSDGSLNMKKGELSLVHKGMGGRCISVDDNMTINGGTLKLECFGDGGNYMNAANEQDYYTPKCITADDTIQIRGGDIHCLSTGLGGKGIVAGKLLSIGNLQGMEEPIVKVETKGTCIFDDVDEDKRYGCSKGIKVEDYMEIINGHVNVSTKGQGGEGLECKGTIKIYSATIICETFDDGINVGQHFSVNGTSVFCHSINNDGIDSNGKITINDGIVVSISEHDGDESFDSETGRLYIYGGTVFGVGNDWVKVRESEQPVYTTNIMEAIENPLVLQKDKYLAIGNDEKVLFSLYIPYHTDNAFITCSSPLFYDNYTYKLLEAKKVLNEDCELFDGWLKMSGELIDDNFLKEIMPIIFINN